MGLTLHGYHFSVYVRIARIVMVEKGLTFEHVEVDPFADLPASYLALNPFGRVPTLIHDGFVLYETGAIIRYLDEAFDGPRLQPDDPRLRARMNQIIAVADSYGYWPLVRQVYAQRVFRPAIDEACDADEIGKGLRSARVVLASIESLASEDVWLCGKEPSLADFHFGAMIGCFAAAPEGERMLFDYPRLQGCRKRLCERRSYGSTDPGLPSAD